MGIYVYFKSGKSFELIPQIRLTRSKNGTTGTAIIEINIDDLSLLNNSCDPIYNVALRNNTSIRMADTCHFIWSSGRPIKFVAMFIFSTTYEKQNFFNYYPYYAINNCLEFFPAQLQEKL
uniref:Photosystem II protein psb28 n=1 Tax=Eustigmatophyceae sp. Chic 10/23 P-6w TaxID=1446905 RepID=A0A3R5QLN0_9STRA|nr:photosystem II protein psb28 [Eustigmatophyceae sp. Chic 10/23 P-6w]QAA11593.1 photosystem II protein psb28 [Eustigmatophyceae sp. Chic 10/23 P-6w]